MIYSLVELMEPFLAIIVVIGGFLLIYFKPDVKTEIIGLMTLVLSFYFGSSKGSADKTKILAKEITNETKTEVVNPVSAVNTPG